MERTLEIMMEELRLAEEEKRPLSEAIGIVNKKIQNLNNEIETYKLSNELYYPMSELANYKGKDISHIVLVERNKDNTLSTEYMCRDEIFCVDENGHLDYSSYNYGLVNYDEKIGKYVKWFHHYTTEHDYVGFLEIELEDDD